MLIQCQSCNTKYRLNLDQIPRRKTFVRCKSCGTPIYIDPTEEVEPAAGVIPPPPGTMPPETAPRAMAAGLGLHDGRAADGRAADGRAADGQVQVVCPSCGSRYRIDEEMVQRPGVKLKCTQCGHLFAPPAHLRPPAVAQAPAFQAAMAGSGGAPAARAGGEMPLPDEGHMDRLFDDLRPEPVERVHIEPPPGPSYPPESDLGTLEGVQFENEPPAPDSDRAYMDAVALDDEGGGLPEAGTIPDDQKFRFFLNPKAYQGSDAAMADHPDDLDAPRAPDEAQPDAADFGGSAELPALGEAEPAPVPSTQRVAGSREEMSKIREVVPGQAAKLLSEKRVVAIVAAAAVMILVATGAWGYWLATTAGSRKAYQMQFGQPHQLAMANDLQGHFVTNSASGKRLFVVNGEVTNQFPSTTTLRWIRIKGLAYTDPAQTRVLGTTYSYAGNVLQDSQLAQWELPAIRAYYGFTNGRKELNFSIPSGAKVPYQLVFDDVQGDVGRTVAQIVSYQRDGQSVFIDNP